MTHAKALTIPQPRLNVTFDPHIMGDLFSMMMIAQVHRGLLRYTPDGQVLPDLAEGWLESPDKLRYVFRIRGDAKFSDGSSVTAEDVRQSFARLFFRGSSMGADLNYIYGVDAFRKTKRLDDLGITVKSPKEVEFRLSRPSALLTKHLATIDCAILHLNNFADEIEFSRKTPSSGPYMISEIGEDAIVVEKWRADRLDSKAPPVQIRFLRSDESPLNLASAGLVDSIDKSVVSESQRSALVRSGWKETVTEVSNEIFLVLNPDKIDKKTRALLFAKTDQATIINNIGSGNLKPAYGLIPYGMPGVLQASDLSSLMGRENKYPTGKVFLEFPEDFILFKKLAEQLQRAWSKTGITVELIPLNKKEALKRTLEGTSTGAIIAARALDYFDGYSILAYFRDGYDANYFHVHDPSIDKALDDSVSIFDPEKRIEAYKRLQIQILEHFTVIPLVFGSEASGLWSGNVKYVPAHPGGIHTFGFETIEMVK